MYHDDELRHLLSLFEDKSKEIRDACIKRKSEFAATSWTMLNKNKTFGVKMWFDSNHRDWTVKVEDDISYSHISGIKKEIVMNMSIVNDPQYLPEVLLTLDEVINNLKCKKRKLEFMT